MIQFEVQALKFKACSKFEPQVDKVILFWPI